MTGGRATGFAIRRRRRWPGRARELLRDAPVLATAAAQALGRVRHFWRQRDRLPTGQQPAPAGLRAHDAVRVRSWTGPPRAVSLPSALPAEPRRPRVPPVRGAVDALSAPTPRPRRRRRRAPRRASASRRWRTCSGRGLIACAAARRCPRAGARTSVCPARATIERMPLCVPALPCSRMRSLPSGRSKSSYTTSRSSSGAWCLASSLAHGDAGQVHVGRGLDEHQIHVLVPAADRRRRVARLGMAGPAGPLGQPVQHHPAHVVARRFVLLARVSQAHDDLHGT